MIDEAVIIDSPVLVENIQQALAEVMDPEIPVLSVIDLGVIGDIETDGKNVIIKLIPTFTACPAIRIMQQQIKEKISLLGFEKVEVLIDHGVAWNSDRMSEEAKKKLEQFGLGIPLRHDGNFDLTDIEYCSCPHCGSTDTTMNSLFGSTLCRSMHFCFSCKQGFEKFKPL